MSEMLLVMTSAKAGKKSNDMITMCHGNSDVKETQIKTNFHLYIKQLW